MADIQWTAAQEQAITHRGSSMIVSAAAGSGKTAVLVERVLRLIETTDVDRLLVVTFTNAAAANMKQGIHKAILKKLQAPLSKAQSRHYARQLSLLQNANIMTLHAFCSRFVREHFDALSLSPAVKLGDQTQLELLLKDAIDQAIEEGYAKSDPTFLNFAAQTVSKTNDTLLSDILLALYRFLMSLPQPEEWLMNTLALYQNQDAAALLNTPVLRQELQNHLELLESIALRNLNAAEQTPDYQYALACMQADLTFARKLKDALYDLTVLSSVFENEKPKTFRLVKKGVPSDVSDALNGMRAPYKNALKNVAQTLHAFAEDPLKEFLALQQDQVAAIVQRMLCIIEKYTAAKREKEILDFDDLEHLTIRLLYDNGEKTPLAAAASSQFDAVIIDEYQDTNLVQEAILTALSDRETNLFMVGDLKQSIYGFRNTVPELFARKVDAYRKENGGACVYLSENFRSRQCVLDFANLVFSQLMRIRTGGSPYTDTEALHKKGNFPEADECCEVYILTDALYQKSPLQAEALFCAKRIHELVESEFLITDKSGEMRPVTYGDIVILTRSAKQIAATFTSVLIGCGIPVYCDDYGESFLDSMEIQSFLAFLRAMDNPLQDIELLSAFTSPIFGKADIDLVVRARLHTPGAPLYTCFQQFPDTEAGCEKIHAFLDFLQYWRKKAMYLPVPELLTEFLTQTGFDAYIESLNGGEQRLSNLRHLKFLAGQNYPGAETGGLYAFLSYLEKHRGFKSGLTSPKILPENTNLVQISTIHKSKGLEYPIVFLVGTDSAFTGKDSAVPILCHRDIGFGLTFRDVTQNLKIESPVRELIQKAKKSESIAEELRILYVALTRAKDKTIVTGYARNPKRLAEYAQKASQEDALSLPPGVVTAGQSFLEWILLALNRESLRQDLSVHFEYVKKIEPLEETQDETDDFTPAPPSAQLIKRLEYVYPHLPDTTLYSKISVTELKRLQEETMPDTYKLYASYPDSVSFQHASPAQEKGILTHLVLEKMDFSETDARHAIETCVQNGQLTPEEAQVVDAASIDRFLSAPLCQTLRGAVWIEREFSFNIHIDGGEIRKENTGTPVQMQGTVDLLAYMQDAVYVIDFKTDRLTKENTQPKIDSYSRQLAYYKMGMEKMFPERPIKGCIYFLQNGTEIWV